MVVLGLTGGIATGKNFISDYIAKKGFPVFDADAEVHKLFNEQNDNIYRQIIQYFPECIYQGAIERDVLGKIAFADANKLKKLENIVYPELTKKLDYFISYNKNERKKLIVINAPTLYKARWESKCNYIIFIHTNEETQKERYLNRGENDLERFQNIQNNVGNEERYKSLSDFVLDTTRSKEEVLQEIDKIIDKILKDEK